MIEWGCVDLLRRCLGNKFWFVTGFSSFRSLLRRHLAIFKVKMIFYSKKWLRIWWSTGCEGICKVFKPFFAFFFARSERFLKSTQPSRDFFTIFREFVRFQTISVGFLKGILVNFDLREQREISPCESRPLNHFLRNTFLETEFENIFQSKASVRA